MLVALAGALFTIFGRPYLQGEVRGWIYMRFDELYFWAQWTAFWMTLISLPLLFSHPQSRSLTRITWRMFPAWIAIALCLRFVIRDMPEASNRDRWRDGHLGLRVFIQTKLNQHRQMRAHREMLGRFDGRWTTATGHALTVNEATLTLESPGAAVVIIDKPTQHRRYGWESPDRLNYLFVRVGMRYSPLRRNLQQRPYPLLEVHLDDEREYTFLLLEASRLFPVFPDGGSVIYSRPVR